MSSEYVFIETCLRISKFGWGGRIMGDVAPKGKTYRRRTFSRFLGGMQTDVLLNFFESIGKGWMFVDADAEHMK